MPKIIFCASIYLLSSVKLTINQDLEESGIDIDQSDPLNSTASSAVADASGLAQMTAGIIQVSRNNLIRAVVQYK